MSGRFPILRVEAEMMNVCVACVFRLAFRSLVRKYGCDIAYTPMIVSDSFVRSQKARDSDFTTNTGNNVFSFVEEYFTLSYL